jgi:hypothetical protein
LSGVRVALAIRVLGLPERDAPFVAGRDARFENSQPRTRELRVEPRMPAPTSSRAHQAIGTDAADAVCS